MPDEYVNTMPQPLELGDRVRVNDTCAYPELVGDIMYVSGLVVRHDLSVNVTCHDHWPPGAPGDGTGNAGSDEWSVTELDVVP